MFTRKFQSYFCMAFFSLSSLQAGEAAVLKSDSHLRTGAFIPLKKENQDLSITQRSKHHSKNKCCRSRYGKNEYDYIIVGNGTAGAVLARKLSDGNQNRVLVLEAGENLSDDPIVLNPDIFATLEQLTWNPKFSLAYPYPLNFGFQSISYTEGRMWGGSSAHNYLLAVRGTSSIYQAWADFSGNDRWTYENLLPTFEAIETYTGLSEDPNQRGTDGPIFVTQTDPIEETTFTNALVEALGTPLVSDYNVSPQGDISTSTWQQFISPGPNPPSERSFSITGYLPNGTMPNPVVSVDGKGLDGRKLRILSNAHVSNVIFKHHRAVGVNVILSPKSSNEKVIKAYARKKILLCAGAIQTPAILQRSGIGDEELLRKLNIPVIFHNPNVGQNLSNQYGPPTTSFIPDGNNQFIQSMATGFPYYPKDGKRRMQFIYYPFGVFLPASNFILDPKTRGSITIVSKDPTTYPIVDLNFFGDDQSEEAYTKQGTDAYTAVSILKLARDVALDAGGEIIQPDPSLFDSDAALFAYCQNVPGLALTQHISGTTRMGISPETGVVDGNLHVFGVKNLMIADLGVAPYQPDGNPCFAVYAIAEQASEIILNDQ